MRNEICAENRPVVQERNKDFRKSNKGDSSFTLWHVYRFDGLSDLCLFSFDGSLIYFSLSVSAMLKY